MVEISEIEQGIEDLLTRYNASQRIVRRQEIMINRQAREIMRHRRSDAIDVAMDFLNNQSDAAEVVEEIRQAVDHEAIYKLAWNWLDNRADADCDQDGFIPNSEMIVMSEMQEIMKGGPGL